MSRFKKISEEKLTENNSKQLVINIKKKEIKNNFKQFTLQPMFMGNEPIGIITADSENYCISFINSYNIKEELKLNGYKYNGNNKTWELKEENLETFCEICNEIEYQIGYEI